MIFTPRTVKEQANKIGYTNELERAGCEILSDCCTCLTPLINKDNVDAGSKYHCYYQIHKIIYP